MRHHRTTKVRLAGLTASAGLIIGAAVCAAPAQAGPLDDAFLSALNGAGVNVGDPETTAALGQSICPALTQPAGEVASAASPLTGLTGNAAMSPEMAQLFTQIAVSMYCPQMLSQLASGQVPSLPQIPGMTMPAGLPAGLPGLPVGLPGLPAGL